MSKDDLNFDFNEVSRITGMKEKHISNVLFVTVLGICRSLNIRRKQVG